MDHSELISYYSNSITNGVIKLAEEYFESGSFQVNSNERIFLLNVVAKELVKLVKDIEEKNGQG